MFIKDYQKLQCLQSGIHGQPHEILCFKAVDKSEDTRLILIYDLLAHWLKRELTNPVDTFCGARLQGFPVSGLDCEHFQCTGIQIYWSYEVKGTIIKRIPGINLEDFKITVSHFRPRHMKTTHLVSTNSSISNLPGDEVHFIESFSQKLHLNQKNRICNTFSEPILHDLRKRSFHMQAKIA